MPRKPQDQDRYIVRFPDGMRDQLKQAAAQNGRSLNAEIVHRLEESLAIGKMRVADFLSVQEWERDNAILLANALRRIAQSVEMLGSGAIEILSDKPEEME